jgi:hypothetical protein
LHQSQAEGQLVISFACFAINFANFKIPIQTWTGLTAHGVNNGMAIKYPGLWYQQSGDDRFKNAVYAGL